MVDTWVAVVTLVMGVVLLTESIFMLQIITVDPYILKQVRRLVCHQAIVLILLSTSMISTTFLYFTAHPNGIKCFISHLVTVGTETLTDWGTVLLSLYGVALRDSKSALFVAVMKGAALAAIIAFTWILMAVKLTVMFVTFRPWSDMDCDSVSEAAMLTRALSNTVCAVVLAALVLVYFIKDKRGIHMVQVERRDSEEALKNSYYVRLAGTLRLVSTVSLVLSMPRVLASIYHVIEDPKTREIDMANSLTSILWYLNQTFLFVIFLARHKTLRDGFKKTVCRKCFLYGDETFTKPVSSRYDMVQLCREMLDTAALVAIITHPKQREHVIRMLEINTRITETNQPGTKSASSYSSSPVDPSMLHHSGSRTKKLSSTIDP